MTQWTEQTRRELAHIEIFPLEVLRILPACGDFDAGIYFLWNDDKLQYIGKSKQIGNRLGMHEWANTFGHTWSKRPNMFPYTHHTCIVVESGRIISDGLAKKLKPLERAYIAHYEPPFNCLNANVGT